MRKFEFLKSDQGFTLIELIVVIGIMASVLLVLMLNLGARRNARDLNIAVNELVTNIRKAQSYTLSSRVLPNGQNASYYVLRFNINQGQYTLQSIFNATTNPQEIDVESISMPKGVVISSVDLTAPSSPTTHPNGCILLALKLPYGKLYANGVNQPGNCNTPTQPYTIISSDHYNDILTFVTNTPSSPVSTDFNLVFHVTSQSDTTLTRTVTVSGVTGVVTFSP